MGDLELLTRVAACLLSLYSLGLGAWALTELAWPEAHRLGLRLLSILAGQIVLTAVLVLVLGLAGVLTAPCYLAGSILPGLAALYFQRSRPPRRALHRLLGRALRLLVAGPAWGLGWLTAFALLFLASRFLALPHDIDALSIHGPQIVESFQSGRVSLGSHWNYPQVWEYQFVPGFLLLRGDLLAILPGLVGLGTLFLAVRELAARLRLPGHAGYLLAVFSVSMGVVWRDVFKNDTIFAAGLLLGILVAERALRRPAAGPWPIEVSSFLVLGTKPSGFAYALLLFGLYFAASFHRHLRLGSAFPWRSAPRFLAITALCQLPAAAVQLRNAFVNGNPFYPVQLRLAGFTLSGPVDLSGTSILERLGQPETWRQAFAGGQHVLGISWPLPLLLLVATLAESAFASRETAPFVRFLPALTCLLFLLYAASPWSGGPYPGNWDYLTNGSSLRYAIAPLCLAYLLSAASLYRWFGSRRLALAFAASGPLLILMLWRPAPPSESLVFFGRILAAGLLCAALGFAFRRGWPGSRRSGHWRSGHWRRGHGRTGSVALAAGLLLLAFLHARRIEKTRESFWLPEYAEVWTRIWKEKDGSKIALNHPRALYRYVLYGSRFQNRLVYVPIEKGSRGEIPADVSRFYLFARGGREELDRFVAAVEKQGWRVAVFLDRDSAALLERDPSAGR